MLKKAENDKGFLVLKMSVEDNQKIGGLGICDYCNCKHEDLNYIGYYIAALNHWNCAECYDNWLRRAKRYSSDIPIEEKRYERMLSRFEE